MHQRAKLLPLGGLVWALAGCGEGAQPGPDAAPLTRTATSAPSSKPRSSDARYHIEWHRKPTGERVWLADHPVLGLRSEFARGRVLLQPAGSDAQPGLSLRAVAWGCADALEEVPAREPTRSDAELDRISFGDATAPFVEWYRQAEAGLEQGFTVSKLPACAEASGQLLIRLDNAQGWSSSVAADGSQATFASDSGAKIRYSDAYARGALGGVHAVRIVTFEGDVALEIDTRGVQLPLEIDPLAWTDQQKLVAGDTQDSDAFGHGVALSGNWLASGAPGDDDKGADAGAVYAYTRTGTTWAEDQKVFAADAAAGDNFGSSVAVTSTYLAAGASLDGAAAGSVYVYSRVAGKWAGEKKVVAPDAQPDDQFGSAVALDATTLVVGAPFDGDLASGSGAAYVFTFNGTNWVFQQKLTATDAGADADDNFGTSVAISGNTIIVGSPYDSDVASSGGAAYVFLRTGNTWAQQQKLVAGDAKAGDYAGEAVAIDANSVVVGAHGNGDKAGQAGAAWVWTRNGAVWSVQQKLFPKDPVAVDRFGDSVAIRGDVVAVASTGDDNYKGSAYLFTRAGTVWTEGTKVKAADGQVNHLFGCSLSLDGTLLASGAEGFSPSAPTTSRGAVYLESLTDGSTCVSSGDCHSGFCVEGVCCNAACTGLCQSCLASRKAAGADGVCGNIKLNTDPRDGCAAQTASTCGTTGVCNGAGACTQFATGTECAAAACPTTTSEDPANACNGSGACLGAGPSACKRGYLCKAGACATTCTTPADCDASKGFTCGGGKCVVPQGQACGGNTDCALGFCVDGVCCDHACDQKCNSCLASEKVNGADGVCGPIKVDTDPADECAPAVGDACGADGFCDGQGACRSFAKPQTPCLDSSCVDTAHESPARTCSGAGACSAKAAVACARGYLCKAGGCLTSCVTTADCDTGAGFECSADHLCQVPQAGACQVDLDCTTGHCSDGVCCNTACDQNCNSCLKTETGVDTGTCAPIPADQDPASECPDPDPNATGDAACGPDGMCDGVGNCRSFAKPSTACGATHCDGATDVITGKLCDGEGVCTDDSITCAPYVCATATCSKSCEDDADCHAPDTEGYVGAFCNLGTCAEKLPDGSACERAEGCQSGFCTDGSCCNKACDGQCEACGEKGAEGKCVPVLGEPRAKRAACPEAPADEPCQAASCNGKVTDHCAGFASSKVKCQDPLCEDGQATGQGLCDGDGNCGVAAPVECGAYMCGARECLTSCATDKDCVAGNSCVEHECLSGAKCSDDGLSVVEVSSLSTSCAAFRCQAGACLKNCSSTNDCAPNYLCDVDSKQCVRTTLTPSNDDGGCGCRAAGAAPAGRSWLAALLSLTLLGAWRRRRAA